MQVYADKASKAMHDIRLENATLRERLQASTAHQAADTAACQQLQGQLARAQEGMLQLEAQQAGHAEQLADVTGQLAGVQVQLEAGRTGREAQQAQQQELLALREQLAVVQTERNAAAELQQQAASQIALLRSRSVSAGPCCQQAWRLHLPALTGSTGWVHVPCLEAVVGHRQQQRPWLPHFTCPSCQQRCQKHCFCCREVELGSLRRMVRELQGMQRGADELRAADEVMVQPSGIWRGAHYAACKHLALEPESGCSRLCCWGSALHCQRPAAWFWERWACSRSSSLLSAGPSEGA